MALADLDAELLAAHEAGDKTRLIALYVQAADTADTIDATCFYLTHAYVFALDVGDNRSNDLHNRLKKYGREA